jgi:hypothetical protein
MKTRTARQLLSALATFVLLVLSAAGGTDSTFLAVASQAPNEALIPIDVRVPSASTGSPDGTLAVRVHTPEAGNARYPDGAPVIIWILGGFEVKGINHGLPPAADDVICITFIYPGGEDPWSRLSSDGLYDYRGENCIAALRDVVLYAAGELRDARGRTIDDVVPVPVLHDNIGMIGESNGGNLLVAVVALHGEELAGNLRYLIQWETPVSSQIATRDLGRVWLKPSTGQGDYWNPRYQAYDPLVLPVDYSDLTYAPTDDYYPLFHDGNGDGRYTTVSAPHGESQVPDLNLDGVLDVTEDFPVDAFPVDDDRVAYSRPVMHQLAERDLFAGRWPDDLVTVAQADAYWDLRESVRLYADAMTTISDLSAMVLCNARDHVQALPDKPHIHQAFDGWNGNGAWVKINPSREYLINVDPTLATHQVPDVPPNTSPTDWTDHTSYAIPVEVPKPVYELAGIYQMADRVQERRGGGSSDGRSTIRDTDPRIGGWITYVKSEGIGRIAVHVQEPVEPRYSEGAPILVNVSGFFTASSGFDFELDEDAVGAIYVTYLWPGRSDPRTGMQSEGTFDYGGPDCLRALRDVVRFATGEISNVDGLFLHEIVGVSVLYDLAGLYAFSHSGIVATNVLALHGGDLQRVKFFVGRENPTIDAMYPLEPGHWDDETGRPVHNPFYDPSGYTPTSIAIDYSTVYWSEADQLPAFAVPIGPDYVCSTKHPRMWDKDYWSTELLQALLDNGALTRGLWPRNLALPEEATEHWPFRTTVDNYPLLADVLPTLKVMLVFAADDHVQVALDKPHVHQAYDGFHHRAGLWCRMNPDRSYVETFVGAGVGAALPDNPANREPATWMTIRSWGYPTRSGPNLNLLVPLAAIAEMCDRTYYGNWDENLDVVLHDL